MVLVVTCLWPYVSLVVVINEVHDHFELHCSHLGSTNLPSYMPRDRNKIRLKSEEKKCKKWPYKPAWA